MTAIPFDLNFQIKLSEELYEVRATCTIKYSELLSKSGMMSIEKNKKYFLLGYNSNMYFISNNEMIPFSSRSASCGYIHKKYMTFNLRPGYEESVGRRRPKRTYADYYYSSEE